MDFTTPQPTAPQVGELELLVNRYCVREAKAGRLGRSFGASKQIESTWHYFLILDRRPPNADLDAIACGMARQAEGGTGKASGTRFLSPLSRGWAVLRRSLRRVAMYRRRRLIAAAIRRAEK